MNTTLENNSLSLKWGTLKSWDLSNSERGKKLLQEYREIGMSFSAMGQYDNHLSFLYCWRKRLY